MHPNGAPSTDSNGMSDADHQSAGRETQNVTSAWAGQSYSGGLAGADADQDDAYTSADTYIPDADNTYDR